VLARSVTVLIVLLGSGTALSTLPILREIGTSLLASAGVAGLVVGFVAKPVLGNLPGGMKIALTQPIRPQDVVIVQNEWGGRRCLTHVVEANERAMQVRVLMSAGDAGHAWDLRCRVREGLLDFVQLTYPEFLPRLRTEIDHRSG